MDKVIEIDTLLRFGALSSDYSRRVLILTHHIAWSLAEKARECAINICQGKLRNATRQP